uniref:Uncharacterized protein n=1 Tax=Desertifilum tharense IPPAS B-1220 TaxID=1781255 RepID=A0A1E5QDN7_9CYAN|nr:hypothetical protein BH720_22580 [Desertifilum tharense IPPAS B-1220]
MFGSIGDRLFILRIADASGKNFIAVSAKPPGGLGVTNVRLLNGQKNKTVLRTIARLNLS